MNKDEQRGMEQLRQGSSYELMYRIVHRSGKMCWVIDKGISSTLPDGRLQNKSVITEVTEIKEREERMASLAQTDQLTGLNNKATFTLLAQSALNLRSANLCALLMIDIDSFKSINDNSGHAFGDRVLEAVEKKARALCAAISSIKIPKHKHKPITISVGISFFWDSKPFETIFAEADTSLYRAKGQGKNQCCIWHEQE